MLQYYRQLVIEDDGDRKIVKAVSDHLTLARNWPVRKAPDMPELG